MLDAFIIDRIQREQESRPSGRVPVHMPAPHELPIVPDHHTTPKGEKAERREGGVVIIDHSV
jgi:hypothetical protein